MIDIALIILILQTLQVSGTFHTVKLDYDQAEEYKSPNNVTSCDIRSVINVDDPVFSMCNELTCGEQSCLSLDYVVPSGSEVKLSCKLPYTGGRRIYRCENGVFSGDFKLHPKRLNCLYDPSIYSLTPHNPLEDDLRVRFFNRMDTKYVIDDISPVNGYCHWAYIDKQSSKPKYKLSLTCHVDGVSMANNDCVKGYSVLEDSAVQIECNAPYWGGARYFTCKRGLWTGLNYERLVCRGGFEDQEKLAKEIVWFETSGAPRVSGNQVVPYFKNLAFKSPAAQSSRHDASCDVRDTIPHEYLSMDKFLEYRSEQSVQSLDYLLSSGSIATWCCKAPYSGACRSLICEHGILRGLNDRDSKNPEEGLTCYYDPSTYMLIGETNEPSFRDQDFRLIDGFLWTERSRCHWGARYFGELSQQEFKVTLTCRVDGVDKEIDDCANAFSVPSGSTAIVECNPPYHGKAQTFTCQFGEWIGDTYEPMECKREATSVVQLTNELSDVVMNTSNREVNSLENISLAPQNTGEHGRSCNILDSLSNYLSIYEASCGEQSCEMVGYMLESGSKARNCCRKPYSGPCNTLTCENGILNWEIFKAGYQCFYDPSSYKLIRDEKASNDLRERYFEYMGGFDRTEWSYCHWSHLGEQLDEHEYEFKLSLSCWVDGVAKVGEEHCTSGYSVPPGSEVLVECNPPFVGGSQVYVCRNGEWEGFYDEDLKCSRDTTFELKQTENDTSFGSKLDASKQNSQNFEAPVAELFFDIDERINIGIATQVENVGLKESLKNETMCPSLIQQKGTSLECLSRIPSPIYPDAHVVFQSDCSTPQPLGTEVTYKCDKYFTSASEQSSSKQYRKCKADGTWTGGHHGFECVLECGKVAEKKTQSTNAKAGGNTQWPWHAAVFFQNSRLSSHEYICGATLISSRAVLTTARCVVDSLSLKVKSFDGFRIDLGRHHRTLVDENIQTYDVANIIVHPKYTGANYESDIAIIILESPITAGRYVRPICYPQDEGPSIDDVILIPGSVGTTVGFGRDEQNELVFSDDLNVTPLKVVNHKSCHESLSKSALRSTLTKSTFCAELQNDDKLLPYTINCGDTGNGIYFPVYSSESSRWYLQGLLSTANLMTPPEKRCDADTIFVITKVSAHGEWIRTSLEDHDAN